MLIKLELIVILNDNKVNHYHKNNKHTGSFTQFLAKKKLVIIHLKNYIYFIFSFNLSGLNNIFLFVPRCYLNHLRIKNKTTL